MRTTEQNGKSEMENLIALGARGRAEKRGCCLRRPRLDPSLRSYHPTIPPEGQMYGNRSDSLRSFPHPIPVFSPFLKRIHDCELFGASCSVIIALNVDKRLALFRCRNTLFCSFFAKNDSVPRSVATENEKKIPTKKCILPTT